MELEDYFKNAKAYIWDETFAMIKSKKIYDNAFANISDKDEITVIIDQTKIVEEDVIKIEKDWKIITLDVVFPADVVGVTAKIATALAKAGVTIMPIAAYSRDHFLVKEKDLEKAKKTFEEIGIKVK